MYPQAASYAHVDNFPRSWMVWLAEALSCRLIALSLLVLDVLDVFVPVLRRVKSTAYRTFVAA